MYVIKELVNLTIPDYQVHADRHPAKNIIAEHISVRD